MAPLWSFHLWDAFWRFLDVVGDLDFTLTCDLCSREQVGMLFVLVTLFLP